MPKPEEVWVKIHRQGDHVLVAICDAELLGRELKQGKLVIKVSEHFYGGFRLDVEEALKIAEEADSINLMGGRVVEAAARRGLIDREAVVTIASVPYAMAVKV